MFKAFKISGTTFKMRVEIKVFKSQEALDAFLVKADRDQKWSYETWKPFTGALPLTNTLQADLKAGTYAFVGQQWRNIKTLDASLLAHC